MKRSSRGFTLVEILIVVIILGILAAIVIPQFTNASNDARKSSVASTLQTVRSQIELYKIQHSDKAPLVASMWTGMLFASNTTGATTTAAPDPVNFPLGPYVQAAPVNPANGLSGAGAAATGNGWVYSSSNGQYTIWATDTTGTGTLSY